MSITTESGRNPSDVSLAESSKRQSCELEATSALRPLDSRSTLVEQVVNRLSNGIYEGEFPIGSELPSEGKVASAIGVSYTVVREAMRCLRSVGLVEVSHGRRPRVKPAGSGAVQRALDAMLRRTDTSLNELTEFRQPLECEIVVLAAQRATPVDIERLEQAIARQAAAETIDAQIEADVEFHNLLALAAGNRLFVLVLSSISELLRESRRRTISRVGSERALADHVAVLDAVRRQDPEGACQAMLVHMETIQADLK